MIRRTRLLDRSVHQRDARFFVVATEGAETEPRYLHALQERDLVPRSRVKIHVLPTNEGRSAPDHLAALSTLCKQKRWRLAVSHPCFELWLLLHVSDDLSTINNRCDSVGATLRARLGTYSKSATPDACLNADALDVATVRAAALGPADSPWPTSAGTHVYKLLAALRSTTLGPA